MVSSAMVGRNPVAVSVGAEQLDVFFVGNDGNLYTANWANGQEWTGENVAWFYLGNNKFCANGVAGVVSRSAAPQQLDVLLPGNDGQVYTAARAGDDWRNWNDWRSIGGQCPLSAPVSVVSRYADQLDAFYCGYDGHVYTSSWSAGGQWSEWKDIGGYFPHGAAVTAVSRSSDRLDLFICGNDGTVWTIAWQNGHPWPSGWRSIGGNGFSPGVPVSVVSRNSDQLDVFMCGNNGRVYTSWWSSAVDWSGFHGWTDIGGTFPAGAPVAAVTRSWDRLDAFICGNDGTVWTIAWQNSHPWPSGWRSIGGNGFAPGSAVSVVSRNSDQLDVFVGGTDSNIHTVAWSSTPDWGAWQNIGGCVPAPSRGLISNANYFLEDLGNNLTRVTATVELIADFVSIDNGFSFQLNCWSRAAKGLTTVWQQYGFALAPGTEKLYTFVANWNDAYELVIDQGVTFDRQLPGAVLKAGSTLQVSLQTDDSGNVTAAHYAAYDEQFTLMGSTTMRLIGLPQYGATNQLVTQAELAPIVALTFNIGGYGNGSVATLTSAAGTITYSADNYLRLSNYDPPYAAFQDGAYDTGESANLVFGALPPTRAQEVIQTFNYVADHDLAVRGHHGPHQLRRPHPNPGM